MQKRSFRVLAGVLAMLAVPKAAEAGVYNIPHFVTPGEFAVGIEPELILTNGAGVGANLRYFQGLNDLMNAYALIGTGTGPRRFRVGGGMTFDFFPDIEGQPGIGISTQGVYYRVGAKSSEVTSGMLELTGIPYLHKSFTTEGNEVEPYISFPTGMAFSSGRYKVTSNVAVGGMFSHHPNFRYTIEIGVAINNAESYVSGGIAYYH